MVKKGYIKINFTGGLISPGELLKILKHAKDIWIGEVSFGLRQQLIIETGAESYYLLLSLLRELNLSFEENSDDHPNVVSSYPATETFANKTWVSEGVYKDIFDMLDYTPKLKINISDNNQSLSPLFTGNINWVASSSLHFWYLFIRFPKTNKIYEWKELVYTNDVVAVSKQIEETVFKHYDFFFDNVNADGELLYEMMKSKQRFNTKPIEDSLKPISFRLPYYEGFNRYNNNYFWLGIYRRDEKFSVDFLIDLCELCLKTKVGQICSTPWKSLMIKGIEDKDRVLWDEILAKHMINVRHAANELNFQVEDQSKEALELKRYIVKHFNKDDIRTFAICFGIKTRTKSEVFSSILVRRKPLIRLGKYVLLYCYDVLCANDFNPNARTGFVFSKKNFKWQLPKKLRKAAEAFYAYKSEKAVAIEFKTEEKISSKENVSVFIHQCPQCLSVYDPSLGDPEQNIAAGTSFEMIPDSYFCSLCEASKSEFVIVDKVLLGGY